MNLNWNNIKIVLVIVVALALFSFGSKRNSSRQVIVKESVEIDGGGNLFINHQVVNKLLIQNGKHVRNITKDALVLNSLEQLLTKNSLIQEAQVYIAVNGQLGVNVKQRNPVARVVASEDFYIDDRAKRMPLSKNHSARVILISGNVKENKFEKIADLIEIINQDGFLKKHIIGVHFLTSNQIELLVSGLKYKIHFGELNDMKIKLKNYKAFFQKSKKDKTLNDYKKVNLEFSKQVVCTKN